MVMSGLKFFSSAHNNFSFTDIAHFYCLLWGMGCTSDTTWTFYRTDISYNFKSPMVSKLWKFHYRIFKVENFQIQRYY